MVAASGCGRASSFKTPGLLRTFAPTLDGAVSTHRPVAVGLRRVPLACPPHGRVIPTEIGPDLPVRPASRDEYSDVHPMRKRERQRPTLYAPPETPLIK